MEGHYLNGCKKNRREARASRREKVTLPKLPLEFVPQRELHYARAGRQPRVLAEC
jgi:hypothetical protein